MAQSRDLDYLRKHCAHDVKALLGCWRRAVRGTEFRAQVVGEKDGYPLMQIRNRIPLQEGNGFYVSTGIHGDEPAPPWALLEWFEAGGYKVLGERPMLFFPCLNPHGVVENQRTDAKGNDLNRLFHRKYLSPIREVWQAVEDASFGLAICLHEDFDGQGAYLYDLNRNDDADSARQLLEKATSRRVPIDGRSRIDGRMAKDGVIFRRRLDLRRVPGMPEAVFLFLKGYADRTLTFETPSEFCLVDRIAAQRRFLTEASKAFVKQR